MFTALQNVVPSHLADGTHYDFKGLIANGVATKDGDTAFDPPEFPRAASLPGLQVINI
jgi:tRNA 2-thiocytidine biosynthesis protein TtcA